MTEVERKKCNRCKMNLTLKKFKKKRDDTYMKRCVECNEKCVNFVNKNKCEHGKEKSRCKECGGSKICEHDKQRSQCKECGGSSICEHDKHRSTCNDCGGSKICEQDKRRSNCKDCGGGSICEHDKQRSKCKECKDPIKITINKWINNSKSKDKKYNRFDIVNFIDKCFCANLIEEYPNCYYCSVELQYKIYQDDLATIERVDNTLGHIKSNCVIACKSCNVSKIGSK